MKAILLTVVLLLSGVVSMGARSADEPFRFFTLEFEGERYPYAVWVPPGFDASEPSPAILFLHGAGECGTDGRKQTHVGLPPHLVRNPERWPFVVVIPQKPTMDREWEDFAPAVLAILDEASDEFNIDEQRVALTGLSQGGHGSWAMLAHAPDRWTCVAPVCAYADPPHRDPDTMARTYFGFDGDSAFVASVARAAKDKPIWAFHGEADDVVAAAHTRGMVGALAPVSDELRMTIYPGVNHNSWDPAYSDPELAAWFVRHSE